jgi:hypothetical protein
VLDGLKIDSVVTLTRHDRAIARVRGVRSSDLPAWSVTECKQARTLRRLLLDGGAVAVSRDGLVEAVIEGVRELTSTNVWFDPSDDIMSNEEELGDFQTETWMRVQGSTNNSRYHWVETASADHITTDTGLSGTIVAESAGQTITLRQGQTLEIVEPWARTDRVAPGAATISVVHFGHRTAQSFTVPVAMPVERFAIKVAKRGAPTDSLTVQICANASGAPGTVLISATIAASALEDGAPDWVWLLVSPYTLAPGTTK